MANLTRAPGSQNKSTARRANSDPLGMPLQNKLRMGRKGDTFEREADRVADAVVSSGDVERIARQPEEEEQTEVQRQVVVSPISRFVQRLDEEREEPVQQQEEQEEEPVQAQTEEPDEEPVQTQTEEPDEEPVQAQVEEEEPVQAQTEELDEEPVQTQAEAPEEFQPRLEKDEPVQAQEEEELQARRISSAELRNSNVEEQLASSRGGGFQLDGDLRSEMEDKFGHDFSSVRIHTGTDAVELCQRLGAQAFTQGSHIYFNQGRYDPASEEGKRLIAHELTHVVQQGASLKNATASTGSLQRQEGDSEPPSIAGDTSTGLVNFFQRTITYASLRIPAFKARDHRNEKYSSWGQIKRSRRYNSNSRPRDQQAVWRRGIQIDGIERRLRAMLPTPRVEPPDGQFVFRGPARPITRGGEHVARGVHHYFIGSIEDIARAVSSPAWNRRGSQSASMEVDHIVELNISGFPDTREAHRISNMELLERRPNQLSGSYIKDQVDTAIDRTLRNPETGAVLKAHIPSLKSERRADRKRTEIKRRFDLIFESYQAGRGPSVNENSFWPTTHIEEGQHLEPVEPATLDNIAREGRVMIFPKSSGGIGKQFSWNGSRRTPTQDERRWLSPWRIVEKEFYTTPEDRSRAEVGNLYLELPTNKATEPVDREILTVRRIRDAPNVGALELDKVFVRRFGNLVVKGLSPVELQSVDYGSRGLIARGRVTPGIPLMRDLFLDFVVEDDEIKVFRTFKAGELPAPAPLEITDSTLGVFLSSRRGLGVEGQIDLSIRDLGKGQIAGSVTPTGGFRLQGVFDFDTELFEPARVRIAYQDDQFTIAGRLGIPQNKVRGIRSATIDVSYAAETLNASGEAELDVPGLERGMMSVTVSPQGWSIGGSFNLSSDIPGIRSGSVDATVSKVEGEEGYRLAARGTAVPDIPGIDSDLTVEYDNGALTIGAMVRYDRGLLRGQIRAGATNRAIDESGNPTGDPTDTFLFYGSGELTVRITPWLEGTVGVNFRPDGQMIVSGTVGLPSSINVFDRIGIPERELFGIGFDIPIFAIPVGPKSIGLKATIRGGLKAYAGIGPGRLEQLELGITYDPDRPEDTHVTGQGRFVIPADAGLKLFVRATVGINAGIGGVDGGLELAGGLGLEASAEAGVNVDWTPTSGLELRADLSAHVQPKLVFTIDGVIEAWVLWYDKEWRWRLADYEYGSNMRFGVRLPIVYREGEPFDISFDDIDFQRPQIDAQSFLRGLIRDVKNRRA